MADEFIVLAFGSAVEVLGWRERRFPADGRCLDDLLNELERERPAFARGRGKVRLAINQAYAEPHARPQPGDEVAIIPPVAGGDHEDRPQPAAAAWLTRDPIDLAALLRDVNCPTSGALASFLGVVRAETDTSGRALAALDYTAYEVMAGEQLERLAREALSEFGLDGVRLVHRLGRLSIGEASVAVVTSAAHRAAAFDACRALIERLKADVPIFKREIWTDGSHSWVE